jgi:hypothetical protein
MAERRFFNRTPKPSPHRYAAHQVAIPALAPTMKNLSARLDAWQAKVLSYAELIPEVMTGYTFVQNTMDMVTFEIEKFNRVQNEWVTDDTAQIQGVERRLNMSFKAGRASALGHLIEEAYVLFHRKADNSFVSETLAPTEIQNKNGIVVRRVLKDGKKQEWEPVDDGTTIIRIFTPDPANRDEASGPHKPLLGLLETMALELSRDQADAISVLAGNGILYIPTEILPDEVDSLDVSDTPGSRKSFENGLEEGMVLTIADRSRGEAIVPLTLYGPAEYSKDIRHILPTRPDNATESGERMAAYVERYARSIDLPAQVILGIGEANHWGDWKVDENTWAYHLYPRGQRIADALYDGLVRGILKNLGLNPDEYRLKPNATGAIAKSDISANAAVAYKVGAITVDAYVEAIGFEPGDIKPDADELLIAQLSQAPAEAAVLNQGQPGERVAAASKNPAVILRQASHVANQHQIRLEALFKRYLKKVADDAAKAGRAAERVKTASEKTAADEVPFLGYKPGVYFAKYEAEFKTATNDELFNFLRRVATLTGLDYRTLRTVWAGQFETRAALVTEQAKIASETIGQRSFTSKKPAFIAPNTIRTMSSTANGGSNQSNGAAGNTKHPTHAGVDPVIKDSLTEAVGSYATQYTWIVGDPARPFEPHQDLSGVTWFSWQEFDELDVADADSWLPGSVYFPGDHDGCQCEYEIEFVPQAEAS